MAVNPLQSGWNKSTEQHTLPWLSTKLAEWIGENLQELGFPDKANTWAQPGSGWSLAELKNIIQHILLMLPWKRLAAWSENLICSVW
jgi:hypothetical protein